MSTHPTLVTPIRSCALALVLGTSVAACNQSPLGPDPLPGQNGAVSAPSASSGPAVATEGALLAQVRAATASYHDVAAATAAGYVRVSPCVYNTPGAKAIHFQKPALVDAVIDPSAPEVLLYEPTQEGGLRLVGVEFLIPSAAWDAVHTGIPALGTQPFMDRRSPPFGAPIPNYALYVWVWRHNPNGMYEQYNSSVSCEFADVSVIA